MAEYIGGTKVDRTALSGSKETETVMGVLRLSESSAMIGEFTRESEDMNELVFLLDTSQNDISELAGKPISVYDNNCYMAVVGLK